MGRVILIEGLDLAGKSTLVRQLRRAIEGMGWQVRYARNGLCQDNPIARLADELRSDPGRSRLEGACLFLAAHEWDLRHFRRPGPGMLHLQDSCWLRSVAFDRVQGRKDFLHLWHDSQERCPHFDDILFLSASLEKRQQRYWSRRRNDSGDRMIFTHPQTFLAMEECLRQTCLAQGAVEVDTSDLSPEDVLYCCLESLQLHGRQAA